MLTDPKKDNILVDEQFQRRKTANESERKEERERERKRDSDSNSYKKEDIIKGKSRHVKKDEI